MAPGLEDLIHVGLVRVHRQHEDAGRRRPLDDLPRGLDAVEERHRDVEDRDVGLELLRLAAPRRGRCPLRPRPPSRAVPRAPCGAPAARRCDRRQGGCGVVPWSARRGGSVSAAAAREPCGTGSLTVTRVPPSARFSMTNAARERLRALAHANQAEPAPRIRCPRRRRVDAAPVVFDGQLQHAFAAHERHRARRGAAVARDVGQRLLDDAVDADLDLRAAADRPSARG